MWIGHSRLVFYLSCRKRGREGWSGRWVYGYALLGWLDGRMDGWMDGLGGWVSGRVGGCVVGWVDGIGLTGMASPRGATSVPRRRERWLDHRLDLDGMDGWIDRGGPAHPSYPSASSLVFVLWYPVPPGCRCKAGWIRWLGWTAIRLLDWPAALFSLKLFIHVCLRTATLLCLFLPVFLALGTQYDLGLDEIGE